jgi:glycosyltransferase involved in cell wall biosynthesis
MRTLRSEKEIMANWKDSPAHPLVSISCLAYNHEPYIEDALEGFLIQETDFPFEILIHDDASTDHTADKIREYEYNYPNLIKPIYQSVNQYSKQIKPVSEFNDVRAKGKYIAICEGDDFWTDPFKLHKQVDILQADEKIVLVITNSSVCDLNGKLIEKERLVIPPSNKQGSYNLHDFFSGGHRYPTLSAVFRKESRDRISAQSTRMHNPFLGDWILWVLLLAEGNSYFLNQVTASYRINPTSLTHTVNAIKRWEADFKIRKQLVGFLSAEYQNYLKNDWYGYFMMSMAYRKNKQPFFFIFYQGRSFFCHPRNYASKITDMLKSKKSITTDQSVHKNK